MVRISTILIGFLVLLSLFFIFKLKFYAFMVIWLCIIFLILSKNVFSLTEKELTAFTILAYLEVLGENFMFRFYERFVYYDKVLHFLFFLVVTFFIIKKLKEAGLKNHLYLFAVLVSLGFAGFWEIVEYIMDLIFGKGAMQGVFDISNHNFMMLIDDTMQDMIFGLSGSIISCCINYLRKNDN